MSLAGDTGWLSEPAASDGPPTRAQLVASELRRLILTGELAPGTRLRQSSVAARLGVSATPVREAFAALAGQGLLRTDAHRGAVVFAPSIKDVLENYEMRIALERLATEQAATRIDDQTCDELEALLGVMRAALDDLDAYVDLNRRFHRIIYRVADRPNLLATIEQLRDAATAYVMLRPPERRDGVVDVTDEHTEIVAALRAHDPSRAGRAIQVHLVNSLEHIAAALETLPAAEGVDAMSRPAVTSSTHFKLGGRS